jgi:hypothetical protein
MGTVGNLFMEVKADSTEGSLVLRSCRLLIVDNESFSLKSTLNKAKLKNVPWRTIVYSLRKLQKVYDFFVIFEMQVPLFAFFS